MKSEVIHHEVEKLSKGNRRLSSKVLLHFLALVLWISNNQESFKKCFIKQIYSSALLQIREFFMVGQNIR